jgi:hypothetical protein
LSSWFVLGLALAFTGLWPEQGRAQEFSGTPKVYGDYEEFAQATGRLDYQRNDTNSPVEKVWTAGWEPDGDFDGDGISNRKEFEGWEATVNGQSGWFSWQAQGADKVYLGPGPDPSEFDSDSDGISDQYEKEKTGTNPNSKDTDGDGIPDAVEVYAGLDALQDGFIYDFETETVSVTNKVKTGEIGSDGKWVTEDRVYEVLVVTKKTPQDETGYTEDGEEVSTGQKKMTQWHPDFDIDGDGLSNKKEVSKATSAMKNAGKATAEKPFPFEKLDAAKWTSPLDCDTDGDWLLDSFENAWSKAGYNAIVAETEDSDTHWSVDADKDGLVTFREQCLHPLLSYGWERVSYVTNGLNKQGLPSWPYDKLTYKQVYGDDAPKANTIGWRYSSTRILNGTPGYLMAARYSKAGDSQRYYKLDKDGNATLAELVPGTPGVEGTFFWAEPKSYWTCPKKDSRETYPGPADCDGDGLADGWEVEHGLNPLSGYQAASSQNDDEAEDEDYLVKQDINDVWYGPSGMFGDPDQDALSNYEEYWGQDGHRIDFITGTGDETIPWIAHGLNYPNQSPFDDYITKEGNEGELYYYLAREKYQGPSGFEVADMDSSYAEMCYPGFFLGEPMVEQDPITGTYSEVENEIWVYSDSITNTSGEVVSGLLKQKVRNRVPAPGVPAPCALNDMSLLAEEGYGEDFLMLNNAYLLADGEGAFQPFATSYDRIFYYDANGDKRYTPGFDAVWYAAAAADGVYQDLTANGDLVLSDPEGVLTAGIQGYPLFDNIPLMMPMPGWDTDNDGLADSMEIRMDVARDKNFSSPVMDLSPLVRRSAHIVNGNGMQAAFTDDFFVFSRQFTIEAWVFLDGAAPAKGTFVRGGMNTRYAFDLGVAPLRVGGTKTIDTVPYFGFHTVGGKWYQVSATQPLPRGRWVHLAGTFNPEKNGLSLYIDGVLSQTRSVQEESFAFFLLYELKGQGTLLTVAEGEDFANRLWIDEVRIWGVERTAAEINANLNHLLTGYQEVSLDGKVLQNDNKTLIGGLMAYYPFDDGGTAASDMRHRAMCSFQGYEYPAQKSVVNALRHEFFYPDLAYAFPSESLGGAFVFDAGNAAPVYGAVDAQQGEYDSDGDGLPDSFEIQNNLNPFAWFTPMHMYARYDATWGNVGGDDGSSVVIGRESLTVWKVSTDSGATWNRIKCPTVTEVVNGELTDACCPNTVLAGSYTTNKTTTVSTNTATGTNGMEQVTVTTNTTEDVTTDWEILSGAVRDTIAVGETWWTTTDGSLLSQYSESGKLVSGTDNDYDGDGLTTLQEYWSRTNPYKDDTNENGIPDGEEDFDGDGLPNNLEVAQGARPDLADTDDDGYDDLEEYANRTSPAHSYEPRQHLAVYFDGKPGTWLDVQDATKYALSDWTIEAKILPVAVGYSLLGDGQSGCILRRGLETLPNGATAANYELRVVRDGKYLYPMARYIYKNGAQTGTVVELRGTKALPTVNPGIPYDAAKVTHLAISYSADGKRLRLYVNGELAGQSAELTASNPRNGEGPASLLRIGESFRGFIDDVRVWSAELKPTAVAKWKDESPAYGEAGLVAKFDFDDGGWSGVLESDTFAAGRYTNILYSVASLTPPADGEMRDGDVWVDGSYVWACDAGKACQIAKVSALGGVFCEGTVKGATPAKGMFGWSFADQVLYRYNGASWVKWGKAPLWLSDARNLAKGKVQKLEQILDYDPTPGDVFLDEMNKMVYLYRATLPMDRPNASGDPADETYVAEVEADPLLPGHRFYLQSQETVVEWDGLKFFPVAHCYDADGLVVQVQSEGMAYKSDAQRKLFRKWGFVPTLEDGSVLNDWENGWTSAARFSGGAQLYRTAPNSTEYTPVAGLDSDGDGLPDEWERRYGLDEEEAGFGNGRKTVDLQGDGQYDYVFDQADFTNGPWGDPDNDGLNNRAEYLAGTNPEKFDTDRDGTGDFDSSRVPGGASYGSLFMDGDDIPDSWESLFPTACSPLRYDGQHDPDGDGWNNFAEYMGVWKTHTSNLWEVVNGYWKTVTNADGSASTVWVQESTSNLVAGLGYYVPYSLPNDVASHPNPTVTFHFKVECPKDPHGGNYTLRIFAYSERKMDCPTAELSYVLTEALRDGDTLTVVDWNESGYLRQGVNYFMAFIDENDDRHWNEGELLGFSEYMPENIQWDRADINIGMTEMSRGFPRVSLISGEAALEAETTSTNDVPGGFEHAVFTFKQGGKVLFQEDLIGCAMERRLIHEWDFMRHAATAKPLYGTYSWSVTPRGETEPTLQGTIDWRNYPTELGKPIVHHPMGTMPYAATKLVMTLDRTIHDNGQWDYITQLRILVKDAAGKAVIDKTVLAPYVDRLGRLEMDFPELLGWGALPNGQYTLSVTIMNPVASATADDVSFTVDLKDPIENGASMVSGMVDYFGYAPAGERSIVIEGFASAGFDQRPIARTEAAADGTYHLRGLPLGPVYLRAYHDKNRNGRLDPGEAWTVLKGEPDTLQKIRWTSAELNRPGDLWWFDLAEDETEATVSSRSRGGVSKVSAVSQYATDYSVKKVDIQAVADYAGNDMVLHDADADFDGLPDAWELYFAGNLTAMNPYSDYDSDGLLDIDESLAGTDPTKSDTDGDGISDVDEVESLGTDPLSKDTDGDGIDDNAELDGSGNLFDGKPTDPLKADSDGDGVSDGDESFGVKGGVTDPNAKDTDGDGMDDGDEFANGYNPLDAEDGAADDDGDGLTNAEEVKIGTDPKNEDTDGDGWIDGQDLAPTDPYDPTGSPITFKSAPRGPNAKDEYEMDIEIQTAPLDIEVQAATNLVNGTNPEWVAATNLTLKEVSAAKTILVPVKGDGPVRMFRILIKP